MTQPPRHRARKRFGQHFLHDAGVIGRIVDAINPRPGQHLVEIGPGLGAMSAPLLERCGELDVVELDRDVIPHLTERCQGLGELRIHQADALRFDFSQLLTDDRPLRLTGNLPYNISSPLLFHLLKYADRIQDMHFMLQKEVVDRMAAAPGSKEYGRLTVMLAADCQVEHLFNVNRGAFSPPPKVESAIVRLTPYAQRPFEIADRQLFRRLVTQAFTRRRKTLRNALKGVAAPAAIEAAGLDLQQRPETVAPAEYAKLAACALAAPASTAD